VAAGEEAEPHLGAGPAQIGGEVDRLRRIAAVLPALVDPGAQAEPADLAPERPHLGRRAVGGDLGGRRVREHGAARLPEVARPALDDAEQPQVVQRDVDRAIGALGVAGDGAVAAAGEVAKRRSTSWTTATTSSIQRPAGLFAHSVRRTAPGRRRARRAAAGGSGGARSARPPSLERRRRR
jgi:hypothetical protein